MEMKIAIITMWYNEEILAPFFLRHYDRFVDSIYILLDRATDDNTIGRAFSKYTTVIIRPFTFSVGFDDIEKADAINATAREIGKDFDWLIAVDADEFIFPPIGNVKEFLVHQQAQGFNLVNAKMWQVYRHITDEALNPCKPAIPQRQHGDPNTTTGINKLFNKPIIVKPEVGVEWAPGCHFINRNDKVRISPDCFYGAHWAQADPVIALERRIARRDRMSQRNRALRLSYHNFTITKEEIMELCKAHENDPNVLAEVLSGGGV